MNLLFLFADQWRRDAVGYRGIEDVITPNIDRFVSESMECANAVSANPLSSPNRAAILTGKYPVKTGVWTNCKTGLDLELKPTGDSIAQVLRRNGYQTGYIGKWHLQEPDMNKWEKPKSGAVEWDAYTPPGPYRQGFDFWYSYGADDNHLKPHYWEDDEEMISIDKWSVEHETDIAIDFIKERRDKKWAMFLSWNPPHTPFDQVPDKYRELYENREFRKRENLKLDKVRDHTSTQGFSLTEDEYREHQLNYYSAISGVDENFGRLVERLKEEGIYDDTLIVLTADHGEMLGSHGFWGKHVWYEESIGVPFILRLGNRYLGRNETVINGVDIMPTLLSMMGLSVPEGLDGMDLKDIIEGKETENHAIVSAYPGKLDAIREFEEMGESNMAYGWRAVRSKDYLYVKDRGYYMGYEEKEYFYHLKSDPYQQRPIDIGKGDEEVEEEREKHRKILKNWIVMYEDKFKL